MAKVTYNNLISEPRSIVEALIKANVSDPITVASQYRKWIYSRMPDVKKAQFTGYPFIVIGPTLFDPSDQGSLGGNYLFSEWRFDVQIITSDRGYGSKDGLGFTHSDSITESIVEVFLSKVNRDALRNQSLSFSRPVVSSVVTEVNRDELIYKRVITLTFSERVKVSS